MTDSFIIESGNNKEYKMVPTGTHLARCFGIIDVGTQKQEFEGNVKFLRKVRVEWELHGEDNEGQPLVTDKGEPLYISTEYTLSFAEKSNLRRDVQNWFSEKIPDSEANRYDLTKIQDKWCMVNVIHKPGKNNKIYANVGSISPVPTIITKHGLPEGHNPLRTFRIAAPDLDLFEKLSRSIKSRIFLSPEGQAMKKKHNLPDLPEYNNDKPAPAKQAATGFDDMADDIPF